MGINLLTLFILSLIWTVSSMSPVKNIPPSVEQIRRPQQSWTDQAHQKLSTLTTGFHMAIPAQCHQYWPTSWPGFWTNWDTIYKYIYIYNCINYVNIPVLETVQYADYDNWPFVCFSLISHRITMIKCILFQFLVPGDVWQRGDGLGKHIVWLYESDFNSSWKFAVQWSNQ